LNQEFGRVVYIIIGPTASGKTSLSIHLAQQLNGEIVSADSRQFFRYMDIGTAKPTIQEREQVIHHCIDILDPDAYFSAGEYCHLARKIIYEILDRKTYPIVVGGSGLYIQSLVDGIFPGKYKDQKIREKLKRDAAEKGIHYLYNRLKQVDSYAAQHIHPNDQKRLIRALEVYEITSFPISQMQKNQTESAHFEPIFWGLNWPRDVLYKRINQRVDTMIQNGLIDEVVTLQRMGYGPDLNSLDSVGYKEVFAYLNHKIKYEEMIDLIKRNTRRFAKRQMTWFGRDTRIHWIDLVQPVDWSSIVDRVLQKEHNV
jgi:tRNA dimethylallyltransferase